MLINIINLSSYIKMDQNKKLSYYNTLVFTIVAGIISLLLIVVLFFQFGRKIMYFIITVEVGIFLIIGYCIYSIVSFEKQKEKNKLTNNYVVDFGQCPDFYTKRTGTDNNVYCVNEYMVSDSVGNEQLMRIFPASAPPNQTVSISETYMPTSNGPNSSYEKVNLSALENNSKFPTTKDKCKLFYAAPPNATADEQFYSYLPWTTLTSRCEQHAL
jgi:Ca2+/Na+ antiporter